MDNNLYLTSVARPNSQTRNKFGFNIAVSAYIRPKSLLFIVLTLTIILSIYVKLDVF
jgi:hypothetical protein